MTSTRGNRRYPSIPTIGEDLRSHSQALNAIKEAIEVHERRVPAAVLDSFVRIRDLVELGIIQVNGVNITAPEQDAAEGGDSPLTTKGDLYVYGTDDDRLPVGTDGQVLFADSTQALGVKWDALPASSGGGGGDTLYLNDMLDVDTPYPVGKELLKYDDMYAQWVAERAFLSELADVDTLAVSPRAGDGLIFDGTKFIPNSPRTVSRFFEDFMWNSFTINGGWAKATSGSGSGCNGVGIQEPNHPGVIFMETGTTIGGYAGVLYATSPTVPSFGGLYLQTGSIIIFRCMFRFDGAIPTAGNGARLHIGFLDEIQSTPSYGIYLSTNPDGPFGDARFILAARNGSTESYGTIENVIVPVANEWYELEIQINENCTRADCWINGTKVGYNDSSSLPDASALVFGAQIKKTSGTTELRLHLDYIEVLTFIDR